jgi:hypothetical protein
VDRIKKMSVTSIMTSNDDSYLVWKSKKLCILVAVHLAILKQMCGVNAVVLYGSGIINKAVNNPQLSKWMQLFLIVSQLVACIGASYTLKRVGRKSLLQIGTGTSFIVLTIIGVAFVAMDNNIAQQILVITSLFVFMTIFCFTIPVVWLYIPEIVPAEILPYTTMSNWAGASITIILFPILGQTVGIGYLFFVFSLWCLLAFMFNYKYVVETKGKTER